jgi:polysaccharide export outer membrane protein
MKISSIQMSLTHIFGIILVSLWISGCAGTGASKSLSSATYSVESPLYIIGPGDTVNVFIWGNAELSASTPVRPDGRITTPLIEDVQASGNTSTQLARIMEKKLEKYIKNPVVTVTVGGFVGRFSEQIRVLGEAAQPQSIPFTEQMTVLDVVIAVGGLTEFAAGNKTTLVRTVDGKQEQYIVRLDDLKAGDISANVDMMPGDVLILPEAWF